MGRPVFCRFCGHPDQIIAGVFPTSCQKCEGKGHWTTDPAAPPIRAKYQKRPRVPYELNLNDRRLLKSLRIAEE